MLKQKEYFLKYYTLMRQDNLDVLEQWLWETEHENARITEWLERVNDGLDTKTHAIKQIHLIVHDSYASYISNLINTHFTETT